MICPRQPHEPAGCMKLHDQLKKTMSNTHGTIPALVRCIVLQCMQMQHTLDHPFCCSKSWQCSSARHAQVNEHLLIKPHYICIC